MLATVSHFVSTQISSLFHSYHQSEWRLSSKETNQWRSLVSQEDFLQILQSHLSDNHLFIGHNTFDSGLILVLHEACRQGITRVIKNFLDNYINHIDINQQVVYHPNYQCYLQSSVTRDILPYYLKAHYKNSLLHAAIKKGSVDIVTQLLEKGADIERNDCCHKTPIIIAIESDRVDILTLLVNAGANVHHQNGDGETTLMYALNCSNKNRRLMLEILLKCGADPTVPDNFGYTVMHKAVLKRNTDVLRDLLSLGLSPMIPGSSSVPCALYLCDFKMSHFFRIINDANVDLILIHPDCLPEHKVDFYLLRACCFFHESYLGNISGFQQCQSFFTKALDCKGDLDLPSSCSSPILAYGNVVEVQDIHEFNMKYAIYKDIGHVHRQLTDYINNEKIERILYQTLVIMERCLGYGNSMLIEYLFHYGKMFCKENDHKSFAKCLLLWSRGSKMFLHRLQMANLSLKTALTLLEKAVNMCFYDMRNLVHCLNNTSTMYASTNSLITLWSDLIECVSLCLQLHKSKHSHRSGIAPFDKYINSIVRSLYVLYSDKKTDFNIERLGRELVTKCPRYIGKTGWPLNLLNSYSTIIISPHALQNEQEVFQQFFVLQLEWGACELVNEVSEKGCRMIQQFQHVHPVWDILLSYGAHYDAVDILGNHLEDNENNVTSLCCLSASVIAKESVVYQSSNVPPRIQNFIRLHDPVYVQEWLQQEIDSVVSVSDLSQDIFYN